jgi:preprotein translocase subunit YajC
MEILILFVGVFVPLFAMALFAMYKERQEERKEHEVQLHAQNP